MAIVEVVLLSIILKLRQSKAILLLLVYTPALWALTHYTAEANQLAIYQYENTEISLSELDAKVAYLYASSGVFIFVFASVMASIRSVLSYSLAMLMYLQAMLQGIGVFVTYNVSKFDVSWYGFYEVHDLLQNVVVLLYVSVLVISLINIKIKRHE